MYLLAPAVLCTVLSFALYGSKEIWQMDMYKMMSKEIHPMVARDVVDLKQGVKTKQITTETAEQLFYQKYQFPSSDVTKVMDAAN